MGGGAGLAKFFSELGAQVTVTDKKTKNQLVQSLKRLNHLPIKFYLGGHPKNIFTASDLIFKGPFVPWNLPALVAAQKKGIPVEMELSFFAKHCPAKIIGITGTRGKSTTTAMIYKILKQAGWPVFLAGSIPHLSSISLLKKLTKKDWVVMELPSWPLSGFHRQKISPHIAVFTNFYPDHLNYYQTMADYLYDKKAIYLYQKKGDYLIANQNLASIINQDKPAAKTVFFQAQDCQNLALHLTGVHNQENAAAALATAKVLGINQKQSFQSLRSFSGLPFRQQTLAKKNQVVFINDTTSTTPIATITALNTFAKKNIILILGGNSKNLPTKTLIKHLIKVKKIVLLAGSFTEELLPTLKEKYPEKITEVYRDLEKAVKKAYQLAKNFKEEVYILFSPAATSFSLFNNEFHRGEEFNRIVKKILNHKS